MHEKFDVKWLPLDILYRKQNYNMNQKNVVAEFEILKFKRERKRQKSTQIFS